MKLQVCKRILKLLNQKVVIKCLFSVLLFSCCSCFSFASDINQMYILSEDNFIADTICNAIDMGIFLMVPLFAIAFTVIGYQAFNGKCDIKIFFTFIVGVAIFKGSGAILNLMIPHSSLAFGCKCATYKWIPDENGVVQKVSTGLTEECETIIDETTSESASATGSGTSSGSTTGSSGSTSGSGGGTTSTPTTGSGGSSSGGTSTTP